MKGSIAAGASFGPTSLGIAMNILRQGKIVNTPVGQLIISAAVIDDMIALIILSQLSALSGTADVAQIVIPIVSALAFLIIGGYAAIYILPPILDRYMFSRIKPENHGAVGLGLMFLILFGMMPATYYAKSSFLMGAFISGLVFCRNHDVHVRFVTQFKRLLQWLMRIFFAASIGFQVPIKDFGNGIVIGYGLLFTVALLGKLAVGFLVPNFSNTDMFRGLHLRDCLVTGFSMAAEGEFAFVIAVFAVDQKLISPDLYASIVLAVLLSTIIPPFALRFTISYYNNLAQKMLRQAEDMERKRAHSISDVEERTPEEIEADLRAHIKANKIVFLCIQIQCSSTWGLIPKIISTLSKLNVEVIDNRSWHPRGVDTTLMTEIFVQDDYFLTANEEEIKSIDERIAEVSEVMTTAIRQPGAKVKVTRWFPGVLQNIVEEVKSQTQVSNETVGKRGTVREILAKEATKQLESKRNLQIAATQPKSLDEIKTEMGIPLDSKPEKQPEDTAVTFDDSLQPKAQAGGPPTTTRRRVRQKMRSTPVVGGSLFDETPTSPTKKEADLAEATGPRADPFSNTTAGQMAELVVSGEVYHIRIMPETIHRIRSGYSGELLDDASVRFSQKDVPIEHRLQGLVRTGGLETISEDISDTESNRASDL
jgi:Kef-type K+ transport system membrane component KefB